MTSNSDAMDFVSDVCNAFGLRISAVQGGVRCEGERWGVVNIETVQLKSRSVGRQINSLPIPLHVTNSVQHFISNGLH